MEKITIVGAGLVGSLLSIYLAKRGYTVDVYERRRDMRKAGAEQGRSINLALSDRGWRGLEGVGMGIADEIRKISLPMYGRMIHDEAGNQNFLPYGKEDQAIYSVSRAGLNIALIDLAEKLSNVNFIFGQKCTDVDLDDQKLVFENIANGQYSELKNGRVFGADGAFSPVRLAMQKTDKFNYSQYYIGHGYKELSIPPNSDGSFKLSNKALHIWPRKEFMLIALPNMDGSFTCTLFLPFSGPESFDTLQNRTTVVAFFEKYFPDAIKLMPDYITEFNKNPAASLVTIKCAPWTYKNFCLIGDAAHGIVPFYGQGMNAGFEDCTVLDQLFDLHDNNWDAILFDFHKNRKPNTDAIADLAIQNFIEMRDLVSDPKFLLRKKIEAKINQLYPTDWIPLYSMVTFSDIPYSEALRLSNIQNKIMDEILNMKDTESNWENIDYQSTVEKYKKMKITA